MTSHLRKDMKIVLTLEPHEAGSLSKAAYTYAMILDDERKHEEFDAEEMELDIERENFLAALSERIDSHLEHICKEEEKYHNEPD